MKKLSYFLLGATGLILASCSQEDLNLSNKGGEANISISLSTPQLQSRAYGKGESIDQLSYAIYEITGSEEAPSYNKVLGPYTEEFNGKKTLNLQLANEHHYGIVFWADKKLEETSQVYSLTFGNDGAEMKITYDNVDCNRDDLDGFYAFCDLGVINGDKGVNADLYRPFAQINVGTNDFEAYEELGLTVTSSSLSVDKLYSSLNLFTGKVGDEISNVTFTPAALPTHDKLADGYEKFPKDGYDYLAMAYVLVGPDQEIKTVTYGYTEDEKEEKTKSVSNVTLKRNHRTNLYGSLLTGSLDANVEVKPGFGEGDEEQEIVTVPDNKVKYNGEVYENITTAIAKALENGDTTPVIYVGEGTFGSDQIYFNTISDLTLKGVGDKSKTIIEFDNAVYSNKTKAEDGVKNVTMESLTVKMKPYSGSMNENSNAAFIHLGKENYIDCIIEGCVRLVVDNEANFENCVFNNTEKGGYNGYAIWHSGVSGSTVNVKGCEFNTVSKGILLYYSGEIIELNLNIEDSKFTASDKDDKAAIMINTQDVSKAMYGTVRIKNTTAAGFDDRSKDGLWLEEKNGTAEATNGFDVYVDDKIVQSTQYFKVDDAWYLDAKTAFTAINDNSVVEFGTTTVAANTVTWPTNKTLTFIGKAANSGINNIEWQAVTGCDLTVKNLTIDVLIRSGNHTAIGFKGLSKGTFEGVTFNGEWHTFAGPQTYKDCIFNYNEASDGKNEGRYNCYNYSQDIVEFYDCKFNSKDNKALLVYDLENGVNKIKTAMHDMLVERCYFDSSNEMTSPAKAHAPVEIHTEYFNPYCTITINNSSYNETNFSYRKKIWYEGDNTYFLATLTGPKETKYCKIILDGVIDQQGK